MRYLTFSKLLNRALNGRNKIVFKRLASFSVQPNTQSIVSQTVKQIKCMSRLALICGSAFTASCLYNLMSSKSDIESAVMTNLRKSYGYLMGCFVLTLYATVKIAPIAMRMPGQMMTGAMIGNIISALCLQSMDTSSKPALAHAFLGSLCLTTSAMMSLIVPYTSPAVLKSALTITSVLFGGLCLVGSTAPIGRFDDYHGIVSFGLLVVFAASIARLFAPAHITAFETITINLGIPVMSGITLLAANDLRKQAQVAVTSGQTHDPLKTIARLYTSAVNLFLMILQSQERKRR